MVIDLRSSRKDTSSSLIPVLRVGTVHLIKKRTKKVKPGTIVLRRRKDKGPDPLPKPLIATTAGLAGILGTLTGGPAAGIGAAAGTATFLGAFGASKTVRTAVKKTITGELGAGLGSTIEDVSKGKKVDVVDALKKGGIAAGVIAAGAGLAYGAKKLLEKKKTTAQSPLLPVAPVGTPILAGGSPVALTQPTAEPKPSEAIEALPKEKKQAPSIKVTVKPEINVRTTVKPQMLLNSKIYKRYTRNNY